MVKTMGVKLKKVEELRMHYSHYRKGQDMQIFFSRIMITKKQTNKIKTIFDDLRSRKELLHSSI